MLNAAKRCVREHGLNIFDIAVWRDGTTVYDKCCFCNDVNNSYSVTKLYINTVIGMFVDEGILHLDDRMTDLLGSALPYAYDPIWDEVTLFHALKHRMGLGTGVLDADRDHTSEYPTDDYLKMIFDHPPIDKPGTRRLYTDVPHYLLSRIITLVTGFPADEVIKERLLQPMHCDQSAWFRCPRGYTVGGTGAFLRTTDLIKLGALYLNDGVWDGRPLVSKDWIRLSEREHFDVYQIGGSFYGKAGQNGQMVMYSREAGAAAAWHGFVRDGADDELIQCVIRHAQESIRNS